MHLKSFGGEVYVYFQQKTQPSSYTTTEDKPLKDIDFKGDGILNHTDFKARVIAKKAFGKAKQTLPPKIYAEFVQEAKELMESQNVEISQLEDKFAVLLQNKTQTQKSLKNLKDTVGMSFEEKLISIFGIQESLQELAQLSNSELLAKIGTENKEDFLKVLYEERNNLSNDTKGKIGNTTLINAIILQLGGNTHDYQMISNERKMSLNAIMNFNSSDSLITKSSFDSLNRFTKNKLVKQYIQKYPKITKDIKTFFDMSFNNTFTGEFSEFNINNFDTKNKKRGLSKYEREQFTQRVDTAMNQMNLLGGLDSFEEKYREISNPEFSVSQWDIAVSNAVDFQELLLGEGKTYFTENAHNYSEEELHKMREEKFDITDMDSMKNFIILLGIEFGDGIEDVLRFLGNILAVVPLQKRYWTNRSVLNGGIDTKDKAIAQMENEILLKENPSLMLCELLGEKGVQMIEELGNMMTSGKNGDIAMMLVTIAGLLAGGAGAVKFAAKTAKMSKTAEVAGKIQKAAGKVDDIVGGAGIGHLTGEFSGKKKTTEVGNSRGDSEEVTNTETLKAINVSLEEMQMALNTETDLAKKKQIEQAMAELRKEKAKREKGEEVVKVVEKNAELSDMERMQKAEELLGKNLSEEQKETILHVHNNISKGIYANDRATLKKMTVELKKVGFESSEIRVMMENGILGNSDKLIVLGQKELQRLQERKELITSRLDEYQEKHRLYVKNDLMPAYRAKRITEQEYTQKVKSSRQGTNDLGAKLREIEKQYNLLQGDVYELMTPIDKKIQAVEDLDLENNLEKYLGESIQSGGSNAQGVYTVDNNKNLVIIQKPKSHYEYSRDIKYFTSLFENDPHVPRVLKTFTKNDSMFQVMERAQGRQLDLLKLSEVENISQEHYNQLASYIFRLYQKGVTIDPSKDSNFFYDETLGFSFIDLSPMAESIKRQFSIDHIKTYMHGFLIGARRLPNNTNKAISQKIEIAIQYLYSKVDDIVGGAGIGHITGEFSGKKKTTEVENSKVNSEETGKVDGDLTKNTEKSKNGIETQLINDIEKIKSAKMGDIVEWKVGDKIVNCKVVDPKTYMRDELAKAETFQKTAKVEMRMAKDGEIISTAQDGTKNVAGPGNNIVIQNPGEDPYIFGGDMDKFLSKYDPIEGKDGVFQAKGEIKAVLVPENIVFETEWGDVMAVETGGYFTDGGYSIAEKSFGETYMLKKVEEVKGSKNITESLDDVFPNEYYKTVEEFMDRNGDLVEEVKKFGREDLAESFLRAQSKKPKGIYIVSPYELNSRGLLELVAKDDPLKQEKIAFLSNQNYDFLTETEMMDIKNKLKDDSFFVQIQTKAKQMATLPKTRLKFRNIEITEKNRKYIEQLIEFEHILRISPHSMNEIVNLYGENLEELCSLLSTLKKGLGNAITEGPDIAFIKGAFKNENIPIELYLQVRKNEKYTIVLGNLFLNSHKNLDFFTQKNLQKSLYFGKINEKYGVNINFKSLEQFHKNSVKDLDDFFMSIAESNHKLYYDSINFWEKMENFSGCDIQQVVKLIDTTIDTKFKNREARSYMLLKILGEREYHSLDQFEVGLKELSEVLTDPKKDLDLYLKNVLQYVFPDMKIVRWEKNTYLENFDKKGFLDALDTDEELAILNTGFFAQEVGLKRSDFASWQGFLQAVVQKRTANNYQKLESAFLEEFPELDIKNIDRDFTGTINMNTTNLDHFLQDGEVKSIWELETTKTEKLEETAGGENELQKYRGKRDVIESQLGYATDRAEQQMEHIVYGGLVTRNSLQNGDKFGAAPGYARGENIIYMELKKEKVEKDALFSVDDTFTPYFRRKDIDRVNNYTKGHKYSNHNSQVDLEGALLAKAFQEQFGKIRSEYGGGFPYVEMHLFNGVRMEDIEKIYFEKEEDLQKFMKKYPEHVDKFYLIETS